MIRIQLIKKPPPHIWGRGFCAVRGTTQFACRQDRQTLIKPLTQVHGSDYISPKRLQGEFTAMLTGSHQPPAL